MIFAGVVVIMAPPARRQCLVVVLTKTVKHNANPPGINQKTEPYTAISLGYKF
ncbi:MAG: hypothetical protein OEM03_06865 [Chromatiales bacterium]|nr:hypothetical protein [Chromatiales bacterium]